MSWQDYSLEELRRQYLTNLTPGMGDHVCRYEELSDDWPVTLSPTWRSQATITSPLSVNLPTRKARCFNPSSK